jgi:hypothetical protein
MRRQSDMRYLPIGRASQGLGRGSRQFGGRHSMRGRPLGVIISSLSLAVLAVGSAAMGLILVATARGVASAGLLGPFGIALFAIAFGFAALFAAIALWQLEPWGWPFAMVVALVGLLCSITAVIGSRNLLLIIGIVLTALVVITLLPKSIRRTYGV